MRIINAAAWSGFARRTAESASDFASVVHNLFMDVRDSYRPELHYMRGPGPKWRAKHANFHMALAEPKPDWLRKPQATSGISDVDGGCVCSNRSIATAIALGQSQVKFGILTVTHQQMSVSPRAEHLASIDRASSAENAAHPEQSRTQEF